MFPGIAGRRFLAEIALDGIIRSSVGILDPPVLHYDNLAVSGPRRIRSKQAPGTVGDDKGYVTVTPDYEFRVSPALREDFDNGLVYYDLESKVRERGAIYLPAAMGQRPDRERLAWHREVVYRG